MTNSKLQMGNIRKILNKVVGPRVNYQPLIEVRVFKDALLHNLASYQKKYPKLQFAPVIKSNAYGHGMVEVAKILDKQNNLSLTLPSGGEGNLTMPFFMVDSFYEALTLRQHGIKTKILVLGYCREKELLLAKLKDVSFGIIDLQILKNLAAKLRKPLNIHLKIDTGMHRQGILTDEITEAVALIKTNKNICLEGLSSHLADADGEDPSFTEKQIEQWNAIVKIFKTTFPEIKFFHTSATAGNHYASIIDANVSRLGLGLYGINPSPFDQMDLRPALEMVSLISSIKNIPLGEHVGYGRVFTSPAAMAVATVPAGYNEGVDRRLSNKGSYKIGNEFCPIVGRVSMNISSVDVSGIKDVHLEQEVKIISANNSDKNSVQNIAKLCDCIPWEILVHIPQHLRRVVV
jgi:alanine racemase